MSNTLKALNLLSAIFLVYPNIVYSAQEEDTWYDKVSVRKTVADQDKPASIAFTNPNDGEASYAIDFGVTVAVDESDRWTIMPTIEYHKDNVIDKEQDVLSGGIKGSYYAGDMTTFGLLTDGELKYTRDGVGDIRSWVATATFVPTYQPLALNTATIGNDAIRIKLTLKGGFDYETIASGKDGDVLRGTVTAGFVAYPLPKLLERNLELGISNKYWTEISHGGYFDDKDDDANLFEVSAIYYLVKNDNDDKIGVQLSYQDGSDPETKIPDQSFVRFGLVFSL